MTRIALDPPWMRAAARDVETAAREAAAGNADMRWLIASDLPSAHRASVSAAYRSTRSVPEALRSVARELRMRADLIDRQEASHPFGSMGLARIRAPKWLTNRVLKIARKTIQITGTIKQLVEQARDYAHLADKAFEGPFWGNFCGAGNNGEYGAPADTLDACCKTHDTAYRTEKIGPYTQFTPSGLMRGAEANRALSQCAKRQPDGTETDKMERFDPTKTNALDIRGDDARSGVMKLFGLMAEVGFALLAAEKKIRQQIDAIPGISAKRAKELAAWALKKAADEILAQYKDKFDELGPLV